MQTMVFETLDSTQVEAKRQIDAGLITEATCLVAQTQTNGYGRYERPFYSPKNGLYMTIILPADQVLCSMTVLTHATAIALVSALTMHGYRGVGIKWINDLYVQNRKVAGMLIEQETRGDVSFFVIGIGLNVNAQSIPSDLQEKMGVLNVKERQEPKQLIPDIQAMLMRCIALSDEVILEHYRQSCVVLGRHIEAEVGHEMLRGVATGIDAQGGLVIMTATGERIIHTGELVQMNML